jgi:HAD superfamily hydrolase (TIGR01509 family)
LNRPAALLWDVDGTMAETERDGHRVAFNLAFADFGLAFRWDVARYGELLEVAGGRERLLADLETRADAPDDGEARAALAAEVHRRKNAHYGRLVREGRIALREGVRELMDECAARGVPMGIATTTSRSNLEALMAVHFGAGWRGRFAAVVVGEDVAAKKPDPEVFELAVRQLGLEPAAAVAIEDSPDGVAAARAAGVPVLVTRSCYFADAATEGAIAIGPGLHSGAGWWPAPAGAGRVRLDDIVAWHRRAAKDSRPA